MKQPDNEQTLPESLLTRLFDCSGTSSADTKGFLLFYINSEGQPSFASRTSNAMVDMSLQKFLEIFLLTQFNSNPPK